MIDKSIEEAVAWLKEHRTDENGIIDLRGMVIDGSIDISEMKVSKDLLQRHQTAGGVIWQDCQKAVKNIVQDCQTAGGVIWQNHQTAICMELQDVKNMKGDSHGYWVKK